jgi:hypothetical protein
MIIEPNENYRKYLPIIGMILFFIVGFFVAYFWMNAKIQKVTKEAEVKLAESQKKESALPQAPKIEAPKEIFSISGKVENIDGQKISLKSFSFGEEKNYQVTVGEETKITKREMDMSPSKEGASAPPTPKETDITLADIKVGDSLTITSADNIKGKTEFIAKSISLEITSGLPAAPDINSIPTPPTPPSAPDASSMPDLPTKPAAPDGNSKTSPTSVTPPSVPPLPIIPK